MDSPVGALGLDESETPAIGIELLTLVAISEEDLQVADGQSGPRYPKVIVHRNSGAADSCVVEGAVQPPVGFKSLVDHSLDMAALLFLL